MPFCVPISNEPEFLLLPIIIGIRCCQFWILAVLIGSWSYLFIWLYVFSMTYDVEHLFLCSLAVCILVSSPLRCLLRSVTQFLNRLFVFLLNLNNSLYILDNSPLLDVSFANIFFQSVVCIILLTCFAEHKILLWMKSSLSIIFFMDGAFAVVSKRSLPYARSSRFSLMLSLGVLYFCVWHLGLQYSFELIF